MLYNHTIKLLILIFLLITFASPLKAAAGEVVGTRHNLELVVRVAATGLGGLLKGITSQEKQIKMVAKFIKSVRFFPDSSGYFFVYNNKGTCVAHATQPEIVGKNLTDLQDSSGQFVIKNLIATAKMGGGFVEHGWKKPLAIEPQDKLGYVAPIPGTDLFIGSGIYFSSLQ